MSKVDKPKLLYLLVDKQFEMCGYEHTYLVAFEDPNWFSKYTKTKEQSLEFKKWAIPVIMKHEKLGKKKAENFFEWFNFLYGLREIS